MTEVWIQKPINNLHKRSFISNVTKASLYSNYGSPTWFHNLPVNLLVNIFKYFNEKELRKTISPVCKRWRYASLRPQLWKKLDMYGKDVPTAVICRKLRDFTHLNSVLMENIADPITVIRQICRKIPDIKHLAVRDCGKMPESVLRNVIKCCKNLETLDLSGTVFPANQFYEEIAALKYLKSVNLSKNTYLSVRNLLSVVLNCHKLEELKLSIFRPNKPLKQLSDEDASFIIWNLAPTLKTLSLDSCTLTNFTFKAITSCSKLEKLGLYGAGNLSSDLFTNIWKYFPQLNTLKIRHAHQITGPHVAELFITGKHIMQKITVIDFTGCWKITDIGLEAIANCCYEQLESLSLKSCKNVCSLKTIHDKCKNLERLNIAFCTNLDLDTVLPLSEKICILIIDQSDKFSNILKLTNCITKSNFHIKMCLSEYNREMENVCLNKSVQFF